MIILGLGSNVGNRLSYLSKAVHILSKTVLAAVETSPIYESSALVKSGSPEDWDKPYLNMAVCGLTHLSPCDLLKKLKMIEKEVGRRTRGVWAPREIDIDILAYGTQSIQTAQLIIPHRDLYKRPFALVPLVDLAPNWRCPTPGATHGKTAYELSQKLLNEMSSIRRTELKLETADYEQVA
jgi:2-amino-4-hydroxy-6-hydroxymethyldihydropteridine diphosphokinase/dihydropteroate synthase